MLKIFLRIWSLLTFRDRTWFVFLLVAMALAAALEVLGIGLLVPIVAMTQDPSLFLQNRYFATAYEWSGARSEKEFLLLACGALLALFVVKNAYQAALVWAQNRFLFKTFQRKAVDMFIYYLTMPFASHLSRNSAEMLRNMQIVQHAIINVLMPYLCIITDAMIVIAILGLLLLNDFTTAMCALCFFGGIVGGTYLIIKKRLSLLGAVQSREFTAIINQIQQSLGSFKETRVLGRESFFLTAYKHHLGLFSGALFSHSVYSNLPRFVNESTAVVLVLIALMLAVAGGREAATFVTLGFFAVAAIRVLPSLTRIAGSLASIKFYSAHLNDIYSDLQASMNIGMEQMEYEGVSALRCRNKIVFEDICFTYSGCNSPVLRSLGLTISALQSVAFVGPSGAGKTTAVDLLLGLLKPSSGRILVDDHSINETLRAWQRNIGYVPQQIFLSDASIRDNVAFALPNDAIDDQAVWRALRMAQLDEFVRGLDHGLDTMVGERGARLSGGQRQRIGIARALYHDPEVLVLDEATAALDNETEAAFIDSIRSLAGRKTLIFIAHRLSTVMHCDQIFYLKNGELVLQGTFDELLASSDDFRRFARANSTSS
jgi:ABC-type multidrug transport system fused ATPase/permease subunit